MSPAAPVIFPFPVRYMEYRPPVDLAAWVACFWHMHGAVAEGSTIAHRVLPDGCADLVFAPGSSTLAGPMASAAVIELRGRVDLVGIRFRPGIIGAFSGIPADQLLDADLLVRDLSFALHAGDGLLFATDTLSERLALLAALCRARVGALPPPDPLIRQTLDCWSPNARTALMTVSDMTAAVSLSERAFERRFTRLVGLPPARYRRLARFRRLLALYGSAHRGAGLDGNRRHDWAGLAVAAGYSDQPHLVRDFRAFAGLTPTDWVLAQARHAGFVQDAEVTVV